MALIDVKEYYYTMLNQYLEAKNDLKDFESALQDGYITEDRLVGVQEEVEKLKSNLDSIFTIFIKAYSLLYLSLPVVHSHK